MRPQYIVDKSLNLFYSSLLRLAFFPWLACIVMQVLLTVGRLLWLQRSQRNPTSPSSRSVLLIRWLAFLRQPSVRPWRRYQDFYFHFNFLSLRCVCTRVCVCVRTHVHIYLSLCVYIYMPWQLCSSQVELNYQQNLVGNSNCFRHSI